MEYHKAMKKNKSLLPETIWVHLTDITMNERSQSQKQTYSMAPFLRSSRTGNIIRGDRSQNGGFLQGVLTGRGRQGLFQDAGML